MCKFESDFLINFLQKKKKENFFEIFPKALIHFKSVKHRGCLQNVVTHFSCSLGNSYRKLTIQPFVPILFFVDSWQAEMAENVIKNYA